MANGVIGLDEVQAEFTKAYKEELDKEIAKL